MSRNGKILLSALVLALTLTAGLRFIQHTDREYSGWIEIFDASSRLLAKRCAEQQTLPACTAAANRAALVAELTEYRDSVSAWWWPTLAAMVLAWCVTLASCIGLARKRTGPRGH